MFRAAKSIQIQSINPILINQRKLAINIWIWFEISRIFLYSIRPTHHPAGLFDDDLTDILRTLEELQCCHTFLQTFEDMHIDGLQASLFHTGEQTPDRVSSSTIHKLSSWV